MFVRVEKNPSSECEFEQEHISMPEHVFQRLTDACYEVADSWERYCEFPSSHYKDEYETVCSDLVTKVMMLMGFEYKFSGNEPGTWVNEGYVERNC